MTSGMRLLMAEHYPVISIDHLVKLLIDNVSGKSPIGKNPSSPSAPSPSSSVLVLDTRPLEQFQRLHIIGAEHYDGVLLSRPRYESESMIEAKHHQRIVVICGENLNGVNVVLTLRQRGYNAILLRKGVEIWQQKYPHGLLAPSSSNTDAIIDIAKLSQQYAQNIRPSIEKRNYLRGTSCSRNKSVTRDQRVHRQQSKDGRRPWR